MTLRYLIGFFALFSMSSYSSQESTITITNETEFPVYVMLYRVVKVPNKIVKPVQYENGKCKEIMVPDLQSVQIPIKCAECQKYVDSEHEWCNQHVLMPSFIKGVLGYNYTYFSTKKDYRAKNCCIRKKSFKNAIILMKGIHTMWQCTDELEQGWVRAKERQFLRDNQREIDEYVAERLSNNEDN